MPASAPILFHVPFSGKVDKENHIIHGVSLITGDIEAEGHDLHVDDTTLGQIHTCAAGRKKITVKADHKGADGKTFTSIVGYLTNFRTEGKKVRGDLQLLESDTMTPKIEEMAECMPQNFGLSVAFKGKGAKGAGGKQFARCEKLISVDLVETPAANPDGLFGAKVDKSFVGMGDTNSNNSGAEPTLADVMAALTAQNQQIASLSERLQAQEQTNQQLSQLLNQPELSDLANMSDEELAEQGFDPAAVRAAVEDALASGELVAEGGEGAPGEGQPGFNPAGTGGAAVPAGAAGAALSVAKRALAEVNQFKAQAKARAKADEQVAIENAFSVLDTKFEGLATANAELATELATKEAEIVSLRSALKTGNRGVAPGVEATTLFNAKGAKIPAGSFEQLCTAKFEELKALNLPLVKAKAQAVEFCVKNHTTAYEEYRTRGGVLTL